VGWGRERKRWGEKRGEGDKREEAVGGEEGEGELCRLFIIVYKSNQLKLNFRKKLWNHFSRINAFVHDGDSPKKPGAHI